MGAQSDITTGELAEAFQLVRDHASVLVHPLIDSLEQLMGIDREQRKAFAERAAILGLADLNAILVEHQEPPTCMEEAERAGIDLTVPGSPAWPGNPRLN